MYNKITSNTKKHKHNYSYNQLEQQHLTTPQWNQHSVVTTFIPPHCAVIGLLK